MKRFLILALSLSFVTSVLIGQGLSLSQSDNDGNYIYLNNGFVSPYLKIGHNFIESNNGFILGMAQIGSLKLQQLSGNLTIGPTTTLYSEESSPKVNIRSNHDTIADIHFENSGRIFSDGAHMIHIDSDGDNGDENFWILDGPYGSSSALFVVYQNGNAFLADDLYIGGTVTENWPDYVFDSDYKIKPLTDLKQDIKSLGHLPGIPSASEIEEGGLQMGQMQGKLLEKIEELTLYVIDLQEQIEELKKK